MNEAATTPEDRAETAARDLTDRGLAVTARAVREAAGVRMAVAAQTAKAWREASQEDNAVTIPETPEDVKGRLDAIWADAYRAALAAVTPERDRLAAEAETLRAEVEALTVAVTEVEDERDQAQTKASEEKARADQTDRDLQETIQALHQAQADTTSRDQQLTALEKDRDRLSKQLDALIEKLPAPRKTAPAKKPAATKKPATTPKS